MAFNHLNVLASFVGLYVTILYSNIFVTICQKLQPFSSSSARHTEGS